MFDGNKITKLVALQSIINGVWLFFHGGKENYTDRIQGFHYMGFLNHPWFYIAAIVLGVGLFISIRIKKESLKKWLLAVLNALWLFYTVVLIMNEIMGVPNMSWSLMLGYNCAIFLAARYEVRS